MAGIGGLRVKDHHDQDAARRREPLDGWLKQIAAHIAGHGGQVFLLPAKELVQHGLVLALPGGQMGKRSIHGVLRSVAVLLVSYLHGSDEVSSLASDEL